MFYEIIFMKLTQNLLLFIKWKNAVEWMKLHDWFALFWKSKNFNDLQG